MPLNQLLHDEQVTLMRAASAKGWREAESYRNQLAGLDDKIFVFALRNHTPFSRSKSPVAALTDGPVTISVKLEASELAGLDHWGEVWGVSRPEAAQRLIGRGMGETSHLLRSS